VKIRKMTRSGAIVLGLLILAAGTVSPLPGSPASAAEEYTFDADADAEFLESEPDENFGSESRLRADKSPEMESVVRFVVDGLTGTVEEARLRVYVTDASSDGPAAYAAGVDWTEDTVTWESRPETTGTALEDKGKVSKGWVEYDVTDAVNGNGTVAFKLVADSSDGTVVSSREASKNRPELVVETEEPPAPVPDPPGGAPNVLIILSDDQRHDTLEVMDRTRHWLAKGGTTFSQGYATTPLCCPSRATFFSGRYMHNHGVLDNGEFHTDLDLRYTLPRYLKDSGYQTAMVGKYAPGWSKSKPPPHFDNFALSSGGYVNTTYNVDGKSKKASYTTDFLRDQALRYLDNFESRDDDRPWFLYLAPQAPHDDSEGKFPPAPRHKNASVPAFEPVPSRPEKDMSDKPSFLRKKTRTQSESKTAHDNQLRTLMSLDEAVDAVFEQLEESGELDNTLVIYTADNGYHWGEHGVDSKGLPYSESVRVPFLVRWPGHVDAGATDDRHVAGLDVQPTVLDAADVSPTLGYPLDGRSLLDPGARDKILLEFHTGHRSYPSWAVLRTADTHYTEYYGKDDKTVTWREYYDLEADPYQIDNLLEDDDPGNDPDVDALSEELERHRACEGSSGSDACP
jgi:arylsulfatase A-like enzyme